MTDKISMLLFDVRPYVRRMKSANPERFRGEIFGPFGWTLRDCKSTFDTSGCCWKDEPDSIWGFIGPLADELGADVVSTYYEDCPTTGKRRWLNRPSPLLARQFSRASLLEATFAAVCEKLEAAQP